MTLIFRKKNIKKLTATEYNLTYEDYVKKKVVLQNYKVPELKAIAKQYSLLITGNKKIIISRIENLFNSIRNVILIQKIFRGNIVRLFIKLRGPGCKERKLCVNETDGYTLEPLNEIPLERFYSYSDAKDFIYGFDLLSLLEFYKSKVKIINPFTRERVNNKILNEILTLGRITKILYPSIFVEYQTLMSPIPPTQPRLQNHLIVNNTDNPQMMALNRVRNIVIQSGEQQSEQLIMLNKLYEIKSRSIETRITDLFIEIDLLGNYTQSQWFSQLDKGQYIRYFRLLYNYWNFRGQIPQETKLRICQFFDPFINIIIPYNNESYNRMTIDQVKENCISVMENMIYCGIDTDYRGLGALYVLSILTVVSIPARNSMYWLYDSLDY